MSTKACTACDMPRNLLKFLPAETPMCFVCHCYCWRLYDAPPEGAFGISTSDAIRLGRITDPKELQREFAKLAPVVLGKSKA
jgi:hypothetical protein